MSAESAGPQTEAHARRLVLVRHGETALNVERRFRGRADPPLTEHGRLQVLATGAALTAVQAKLLLTSPRQRASDTAQAIGAQVALEPRVEPRLDDIDYGAWTGLTHAEVAGQWADAYRIFRSAPERAQFPGGETMAGLMQRVADLFADVTRSSEPGVRIFVTHDVVIRVLLCQLLSAPLSAMHRFRIDVASITTIDLDPQPVLVEVNRATQLEIGPPAPQLRFVAVSKLSR